MEQNFDWDDLIFELGDRNIIPVIGKELLTISGEGGESTPIEQWLVGQLLSHFKDRGDISDSTDFHSEMSLNEFTLGYMNLYPVDKRENRKRIVKKEITRLLADEVVDIPDVLKKLAAIDHFDLFISTTADTLLDQAISSVRGGCDSVAYKLRSAPQDIGAPLDKATVYHIFGTFDDSQDFAVTDEDKIEYLHSVSKDAAPRNLLDLLSEKSLLLIGCGLSKSIVPYLVRTLANDRLFPSKNYRVVDNMLSQDPEILLFWRGFSGEVLLSNDANQFVADLNDRWMKEIGPSKAASATSSNTPVVANAGLAVDKMDDGTMHVFISYRRDDGAATDKIVDALKSKNILVWYDQDNIQGGDDWRREIEKNIGSCLLFIPVLSKNSQSDENVAIEEWNLAFDRRKRINKLLPFILPVVIHEGIGPDADLIDPEFWKYDTEECIDGVVSESFLDNVQAKIKQRIKAKNR